MKKKLILTIWQSRPYLNHHFRPHYHCCHTRHLYHDNISIRPVFQALTCDLGKGWKKTQVLKINPFTQLFWGDFYGFSGSFGFLCFFLFNFFLDF